PGAPGQPRVPVRPAGDLVGRRRTLDFDDRVQVHRALPKNRPRGQPRARKAAIATAYPRSTAPRPRAPTPVPAGVSQNPKPRATRGMSSHVRTATLAALLRNICRGNGRLASRGESTTPSSMTVG